MLFKVPTHHRTKEMLIVAVKHNGLILKKIFDPWQTNQFYIPFINEIADNNLDNSLLDKLWIEICHCVVQNNPSSLRYVPPRYKTYKIIRSALSIASINTYLGHLPLDFRKSYEKMLSCIKINLTAFYSADMSLRNNIDFVNDTVNIIKHFNGEKHCILCVCGNIIKSNRNLVFKIFKNNPMEYKYLPRNMQEDISIYNYAMKYWSKAYKFAPYDFKKNFNITREAVIKDGKNLCQAAYELQSNLLLRTLAGN